MRLTEKRKQVLTGLLKSNTPMSAYELVEYCRDEHGHSLPPMSVYRILDFLESQSLVHKLSTASKFIACAHITSDHKHGLSQFLVCGLCHRVKEVNVSKSTINALKRSVDEAGFKLAGQQIEISCVCQDCLDSA